MTRPHTPGPGFYLHIGPEAPTPDDPLILDTREFATAESAAREAASLLPDTSQAVPLAGEALIEEARRLLECVPTIDRIDIADDGLRIVARQQARRRLAEEAAERLIAYLDELDEDPDLEGDDPDLEDDGGGVADQDAYELELRDEPSLGSLGQNGGSQGFWAGGTTDDREEEHDGAEPDESGIGDMDGYQEQLSGEPDLGWTNAMNQDHAMAEDRQHWKADDGEPSLGWTAMEAGFNRYPAGAAHPLRDEGEPSLGFIEPKDYIMGGCAILPGGHAHYYRGGRDGLDQRFHADGTTDDGEAGDDNGIADDGGLQEQWWPDRCEPDDPTGQGRVYVGEMTPAGFKPFGAES